MKETKSKQKVPRNKSNVENLIESEPLTVIPTTNTELDQISMEIEKSETLEIPIFEGLQSTEFESNIVD